LFILSKVTGITGGADLIPLNVVSFTIATTNSYFLNKNWAFHDHSHAHEGRKASMFLFVSIIGVAINTGVVVAITTFVDPMFGVEARPWLFGAKVIATGVSLVWNFTGYKLFVFKK